MKAFKSAYMNGKLEDAKKIMMDNNIDIFSEQDCYYQWPREYQLLYKWCNENKYKIYNHYFFIEACRSGNLPEVQKFINTYGNKYVSNFNDCAFNISCHDGHMNIAQYLLQIQPNINISKLAFHWSCIKGHIHIAKWLYKLNPTVLISNDTLTYTICNIYYSNKHSEVAKWLLQLKPVIYTKFEYNNICNWLNSRKLLHGLNNLPNIIVI